MRKAISLILVLLAGALFVLPESSLAQQQTGKKAGEIKRQVQPAFVVRAGKGAAPAGVGGAVRRPASTGASQGETAADRMPVFMQDILRTGAGGRIRAELNDGSYINLAPQSQLQVKEYNERSQQSQLQLTYGKVRAQVVKMTRPDSKFEIRTNTAVCGVLGTDEYVDASDPTSTLVVNLSDPHSNSQIVVRNIDPSVPGSVVLNPGEETRVDAGRAPTAPQPASEALKQRAKNETSSTSDPQSTLVLQTASANITAGPGAVPRVQIDPGQSITLDGRTSIGGSSDIVSYKWSLPRRNFSSTEPLTTLNTTGWSAGPYDGTLTITNAQQKSATSRFVLVLTNSTANRGAPEALIEGLRQAYESLQVTRFMAFFSQDYPGYSALEASTTTSFANIASNKVFLRRSNGTVNGDEAVYQVDFEVRFLPKASALPQGGLPLSGTITGALAPANYRVMATGTNPQGGISGNAGAVGTFVTLVGLNSGLRMLTTTGTGTTYNFSNLPPGKYEVTPARAGFFFSPLKQVVDVTNTTVSGVDFSATGQEQVVKESVTMTLRQYEHTWKIMGLNAPIGAAGLVGIPGVGDPAQGTTVTGSPVERSLAVADVNIQASSAIAGLARNSTSQSQATLTISPVNGFAGNVTLTLLMPSGVKATSSGVTGSSFTIPVSGSTVTRTFQFAIDSTAPLGDATIGYQATGPNINKQGVLATFKIFDLSLSAPQGPLVVYAGGFTTNFDVTVSTAPGIAMPVSVSAAGKGLSGSAASVNGNGTATLNVSSAGNDTSATAVDVTASGGGGSAVAQIPVTRRAPFSLTAASQTMLFAGASGMASVQVAFDPGFSGQVVVTPPTLGGFTFTPQSVTLTKSGTASFGVLAASSQTIGGNFGASAGSYNASAATQFTVSVPPEFSIAAGALSLSPGEAGKVPITITQTAGTPTAFDVTVDGVDGSKLKVQVPSGQASPGSAIQLDVGALPGAAFGATTFTVKAAAANITRSVTVTVNITQPFSLAGVTLNVLAGTTTNIDVPVQQLSLSPVRVSLSAGGVDTSKITVTGGGTVTGAGTARFTISVSPDAPTGTTTFTVTGVSGSVAQTATITVNITAFGFSITGGSVKAMAGGDAVPFDIQLKQTAGPATSFQVTTSGVDATRLAVTVSASGTSAVLMIKALATAPIATTSFQVQVTGGGVTKTATISVDISPLLSFSLSNVTSNIEVGRTATVSVPLTQSSGPAASYQIQLAGVDTNLLAVSLASSTLVGTGSIQLNISASPDASGSTSFTVSATANGITKTATVTVNFTWPTLTASATPASLYLGSPGATANVTISVSVGVLSATVTPGTLPSGIASVTPISTSTTVNGSGDVQFKVTASTGLPTAGSTTLSFNVSSSAGSQVVSVPVTFAAPPVSGSSGVMTIQPVLPSTPSAGQTVSIPIQLALNSRVTADSVAFGLTITASTGATALNATLGFTADGASALSNVSPGAVNADKIAVMLTGLNNATVSGTLILGSVTVPLPSTASGTYTVALTNAGGTTSGGTTNLVFSTGSTVSFTVSGILIASTHTSLLSIQRDTITYTPSFPKEGDTVRIRARVKNSGSRDSGDTELRLMSRDRVLARQTINVTAGRTGTVELEWKAEELKDVRLAIGGGTTALASDNADEVGLRGFAVERRAGAGALRRRRQAFDVRNEDCVGIRMNSGMRASCGGSADLEVSPAITDRRKVEVMAAATNGGLVDLGAQSLITVRSAPTTGYQPQGMLQPGHTYALKTRRGYAVFRVVRINSSVDPRLVAPSPIDGRPGAGTRRPGTLPNEGPIGDIRDQRMLDSLLSSARITVDIEWLFQEDGSLNFQ